mmetsp:Transcript_696/g.986  ORF Transcript_696/g.986 Transcript_696/m.986 type:complete len:113 (+) Transcript_696:83-421(+)
MEDQHEHKIVDLDDKKVLAALEKDGLMVHMGHPSHLSISGDDQKGYSWIINEDACAKIADVEVLDGRPTAEKKEGDDKEKDSKDKDSEDKDEEKKDEKKDEEGDKDAKEKDE